MKKLRAFFCITFLSCACLFFPHTVYAANEPEQISAQAAIVCNADESIMWTKNPDQPFDPASITKVMTGMVVLDKLEQTHTNLDRCVEIQPTNLLPEDAKAGFVPGQTISLRELLYAMFVGSENDAAINLAISCFGNEQTCVEYMNKKAQEIGLSHTNYVNCTGLYEQNTMSARDCIIMAKYARAHYPFMVEAENCKQTKVTTGTTTLTISTTNQLLLEDASIHGMKTGLSNTASMFLSRSIWHNHEFFSVVLGSENKQTRWSDTKTLLAWIKSQYQAQVYTYKNQLIGFVPCLWWPGKACAIYAPQKTIGYVQKNVAGARLVGPRILSRGATQPKSLYTYAVWKQGEQLVAQSEILSAPDLVDAPSTHTPFTSKFYASPAQVWIEAHNEYYIA